MTVESMTDGEAGEASLLPGWTRAMVVTHLARNAESNARMIQGRLRGEERPQYPGRPDARAREIEAGRGKSAAAVANDLRAAAAELEAVYRAVSGDQWDLVVPAGVGPRPIRQRLLSRRLEVEVHHVDLGLGYDVTDWPVDFAEEELERTLRSAPQRRVGLAQTGRWQVGRRLLEVGNDVHVLEGGGSADGSVEGDARYLFAWLIGRTGTDYLEVGGDERVRQLPRWFPFP